MRRVATALALCLPLAGCSVLERLDWPKAVSCATENAADLLEEVGAILLRSDGRLSRQDRADLADLARERGTGALVCAVNQLIAQWEGSAPPTAMAATGKLDSSELANGTNRAREFLSRVGTEVQ